MTHTALDTFDGKDNRREIMILLTRLGSDRRRARFLESLMPLSMRGFSHYPAHIQGVCDPVGAYFTMVGICNELGVPIEEAARRLDEKVRRM